MKRIFLTPFQVHFFNSNCPIDVQLKGRGDYHITMQKFVLSLCNIETFRIQNEEYVVPECCYLIPWRFVSARKLFWLKKTGLNLHQAFHIHLWPDVQFSKRWVFFLAVIINLVKWCLLKVRQLIGISLRYMSFSKDKIS